MRRLGNSSSWGLTPFGVRPLLGFALSVCLLFGWVGLAFADVVYLHSGKTLKGLVVEEHSDRIVVNTEAGEQPVLRGDIDEVFYDDPERNYLYLGNQALEAVDFGLARGFFEKSLQINSRFQEAEDAIHRLEDLQHKFQAPSPADPLAVFEGQWGLKTKATADWPVVRAVREDSLAARSGILPEDHLVALWGGSLAYLPVEEVAKALRGPPGTPVKLTLERQVTLPAAGSSNAGQWPGMVLEMDRLGLMVSKVEPKGAAGSAGLLPGDRVVAIARRPTRYLPLGQAQRALRQASRTGIRLSVHRDLMVERE